MKKLYCAALTALGMAILMPAPGFAQDGPPNFRPVELWACSYKERKDADDFNRALRMMVEATGDVPYAAYQLMPNFRGPDQDFDFIYIGVWPDGTTMGRDMANYAQHTDVIEAWDEAVDCPVSSLYASYRIQAIEDDGNGSGNFILTFSDCKVAHGNSNGQALGALRRYNDYRVANGMTIPTFAWFPAFGGGNAEFDFKLIQAYSGPQHFGDAWSWFVDHAAYETLGDMTDGIVDCDEARVYNGRTIMNTMQ